MKHSRSPCAVVAFAALVGAGGSCRNRQPAAKPGSDGRDTNAAYASASGQVAPTVAASAAAVPPAIPYAFDLGCTRRVEPKQPPALRLEQIGGACAAGMDRVTLTQPARQAPADAWVVWEIGLQRHACVRLAAVSKQTGRVMEARLVDGSGVELATSPPTRQPVLLGPVCVGAAQACALHVRSLGLGAELSAAAWIALPPAPTGGSSPW
ncbi:MAG: hypothetical protein MUF54_16230 [Polyangiaceae bacterium]|nr:hypothetical protein [Polyangiaceae bacterium]